MKNISEFKPNLSKCKEITSLEKELSGERVDACKDQFAQLIFKGLYNDIEVAEKKLKDQRMDASDKIVNLDGTAEIRYECVDSAATYVAKFPLLKAIGLCENWSTGQVESYYSESGCGFFTEKNSGYGDYFDGEWESGDGRWAYEYDMRQSIETSFEFLSCGETCKISYYFWFRQNWENDSYIFDVNGKLYRYDPTPIVADEETVTIPFGITKLDMHDFNKNKIFGKLKKLIIPDSVTEINVYMFGFAPWESDIENVVFEGNSRYMFDDGAIIDTETHELMFFTGKDRKEHIVHSSVEKIRRYAFAQYPLEKIVLHDNIKSIGEGAFNNCTKLTSINLSAKLKMLDFKTFNMCKALKEITIPNSVKTIRNDAFGRCNDLTIIAEIGSQAHKFALKKKLNFKSVNGSTETNLDSNNSSQVFAGKIFVMTGFDAKSEKALTAQIQEQGGVVKGSVVLNTDFLIINPNYGSETTKLKRANELNARGKNIKILTEKEFFDLLYGRRV